VYSKFSVYRCYDCKRPAYGSFKWDREEWENRYYCMPHFYRKQSEINRAYPEFQYKAEKMATQEQAEVAKPIIPQEEKQQSLFS